MIVDIRLHDRYEQDFLEGEEGSEIHNISRTSFIYVPFSRRCRNVYLLDLRVDRSVRSDFFFSFR